jgi:hypothetical protein
MRSFERTVVLLGRRAPFRWLMRINQYQKGYGTAKRRLSKKETRPAHVAAFPHRSAIPQ